MNCDTCLETVVKQLPKIKYYEKLEETPYKLRNKNSKRNMMIRERVKKLQNLSVRRKFNSYYISQIEKELYGGKRIKKITGGICFRCGKDKKDLTAIYIRHQLITKIFDFFGTNQHLLTDKEKEVVKKHLDKNEGINICDEWKGRNYYHEKIFGVPFVLKDVIDKERYSSRKKLKLDSTIYFHPKASNGFAQECWEAIDAYQTMYHELYKR